MWLLIRYGYAISAIGFVSACIISRVRRWRRRKPVIAFLHPYCAAGGGGERVLWVAISAVLEAKGASFAAAKLKLCVAETRAVRLVIYTGDRGVRAETIREKAKCQFGVQVPREIELCYTTCRRLIEPSLYPVATLFGQSIGSMVLALDCMLRLPPDVLIDTTGLAFSYVTIRQLSHSFGRRAQVSGGAPCVRMFDRCLCPLSDSIEGHDRGSLEPSSGFQQPYYMGSLDIAYGC